MSDETPPASGSRWEPTDQEPTHQPVQPVQPAEPVPAYAVAEPAPRAPWLTRARTIVAGGAVAVLLAGGLGGFAVGRATAGDGGDRVGFDQQGGPAGFDRDGDGHGFPAGPGGQVPDRNGADDGQQDSNGSDSQDS
jgi:hypothetical protein